MKHLKKLLALLLALTLTCSLLPAAFAAAPAAPAEPNAGDVAINATNFPDPVFRSYVSENFDTNSNGSLSESEIYVATTASLTGKGISDLKGVEYLTSLITLNCGSNNLTSIDVSQNTHLKTLSLNHNNLTTLNVSGHPDLKTLRIYGNPELTTVQCQNCALTGLATEDLPALTKLYCYNNQLTSLDVSQNTALTELYCSINQLTSLNVSQNAALEQLFCYRNQLTSLDLSKNTALVRLSCYSNQLTSLDVSKNTTLAVLFCQDNQLPSLDLSKNTALTGLYCYGNQISSLDLSTVPALKDAVENGTKDTSNSGYDKYSSPQGTLYVDKTVNIITDATGLGIAINETNFPDANFRAFVKQYDTDSNGYLSTAELAAVTYMSCSGKNIADLKGVEHFTALTTLYCYNNAITSLDLSQNTALTELFCFKNQLSSLDVSKNTALKVLACDNNQLPSLDVSKNTALTELYCNNNALGSLDVSKNTALKWLHCYTNYLTSLDVSKNTALTQLYCHENRLTSLDLGKNSVLTYLDCSGNQLTSLDVSAVPAIKDAVENGTKDASYSGYDKYISSQGTLWVDKTVVLITEGNPFADVAEGKYYYMPVMWAYYHDPQVTGGVSATQFGPNKDCTREQIVTFLWKASGAPEPTTTVNPFVDVKSGKYYEKPVLWAVENGITSGMDATHFGVGKPCTREQAMTFLWKAAGAPEPTTTTNPFTDVKPGKYYEKAILWAVENGITGGVSPTKFGVGQTCTRAQIVTFLYKYYGKQN